MRKRGKIFRNFKAIETGKDDTVSALSKMNENLKLLLEVLCDLRVNTSDDPNPEKTSPSKSDNNK